MEELSKALDDQTMAKLTEQKFSNQSLMFINDEHLNSMGICEMGPRLMILSVAEKLRCKQSLETAPASSSSSSQKSKATPLSADELRAATTKQMRELLERNTKFRKILYTKLDSNIVPTHKELLLMVRILCDDLVSRMLDNKGYPTTTDKKKLACDIIATFPILKLTRARENAPDYSLFFWINGGKEAGNPHSGLIHTHLRNASRLISPSKKKYTRKSKLSEAYSVPSEIIAMSVECAQLEATPANFRSISQMMADTQLFHNLLIKEKKTVTEVLQALPHYKSYNGAMIRKAYERMNPRYNSESDLKSVFALGLMLNNDTFLEVKDDHIRGCLRILMQLSRKGVRKPRNVDTLGVEEELASPLVRWIPESQTALAVQLGKYAAYAVEHGEPIPPHIINQGDVFMLFIEGHIICLGTCSVQAIDFRETFQCAHYKIPTLW
ncbi:uncharacterized protein LOC134221906 [Armigeres subalbatus]|uniref:uncharacterized protein LOC134221906 n=1 Tax=Armigeres subalbatus TaxID=124917 RepID=UPI002ED35F5D